MTTTVKVSWANCKAGFFEYLAYAGLSHSTLYCYTTDIDDFVGFMRTHEVDSPASVTRQKIEEYLRWVGAEKKPATVARRASAIRLLFRWGTGNEGFPSINPSKGIVIPKVEFFPASKVDRDHIEKVVHAASTLNSLSIQRDRLIIELILATGMSISEVLSLNLQDLQLEDPMPHIQISRRIEIDRATKSKISWYLGNVRPRLCRWGPADRISLFLNTDGKRLGRQGLWNNLNDLCRKAGVPIFTSKDLQNDAVRRMIENGLTSEEIAEKIGISSFRIERRFYDDFQKRKE